MELQKVYTADHTYCCYCGEEIIFRAALTREHLVPRSWGGNNSELNCKPCCPWCNNKRGNKPLKKWYSELVNELIRSKDCPQRRYRLEAMIENVQYWINYVERHGVRLYWTAEKYGLKQEALLTA
jgi:hypothetical protein